MKEKKRSGWGKRNEESVKNGQGKGIWKQGSGWGKGNETSAAGHGRETRKLVCESGVRELGCVRERGKGTWMCRRMG